ncbi:hypothetical protein BJV38_001877 [Clostridium beijerinckii]|nr:hypothetical protein [Clostridium beijerinckii]NRT45034.1 hypothetical protein [Clostridium beijerinckii]NRZ20970.1 hypothetical protein [Clostridium beijerinckii]
MDEIESNFLSGGNEMMPPIIVLVLSLGLLKPIAVPLAVNTESSFLLAIGAVRAGGSLGDYT